jgi:tetratricopeptide (TPR) repeat protein
MLTTIFLVAIAGVPQRPEPSATAEQSRQQALEHYRRGDEALHSERFAEAEGEFELALGLDPLLTLAHHGLGRALMAERRFPEAVTAFQGCRQAFVEIARIGLRDASELDRRRTEEIAALRDSIATLQRNSRLAAQNQNNVRRMEDRVRELERMRQPGGEGLTVPAEVAFSLGSAYFRAGSLVDAEREYREALSANPKLGEAHNNLAVVCLKTGRIEEAWSHIQAAEKAGFDVNPMLKKDIESRQHGGR